MREIKFGACLPSFGSCADRYCLSGHGGGAKTLEDMFDSATKVKNLKGIELVERIGYNNIAKVIKKVM